MSTPQCHIFAVGNWTRDQIVTQQVPSTRRIDPQIESQIDAAWTHAMARGGRLLFDGPMCRLEHFSAKPDNVQIHWSPTSYRVYWGTNMRDAQDALGMDVDVMANPIGISTAVVSAEGYLLMGRRSERVAYHPNRIHPFAGALEPDEGHDPFLASLRELKEELNLADDNLSDLHLMGLIGESGLRQPELAFYAKSKLSLREIEQTLDPSEHVGIVALSPTEVLQAASNPEFTPVATGVLKLWVHKLTKEA